MKDSVRQKLENLRERFEEVTALLGDAETINDQARFRALSQEYGQLEPVIQSFEAYLDAEQELASTEEMLRDSDPEIKEMASEERKTLLPRIEALEKALQKHLLPKDPKDDSNVFPEIRAGSRRPSRF